MNKKSKTEKDYQIKELLSNDLKEIQDIIKNNPVSGYFLVVNLDHEGRNSFNAHMSSNYGLLVGVSDLMLHQIKNQLTDAMYEDTIEVIDDNNHNNKKTLN